MTVAQMQKMSGNKGEGLCFISWFILPLAWGAGLLLWLYIVMFLLICGMNRKFKASLRR